MNDFSCDVKDDLESQDDEPDMNGQLCDVNGLAKFFKVKPSRIYAETKKKGPDTIPMIRIGKYCRFHPPTVIKWFQKKTIPK